MHVCRLLLRLGLPRLFVPRPSFTTAKWDKDALLKQLNTDIVETQSSILHVDAEHEEYFKNRGWTATYNQASTQFEYSKVQDEHEVRVLTHLKTDPPNNPDRAKEATAQLEDPNRELNYSRVAVNIKKTEADKWLVAQLSVFQGSVELVGVFFASTPSFQSDQSAYPGPELSTLPETVIIGINSVFTEFGLSPEVLMNMVIHTSIKVDDVNLQWLKDLREIWR